MIGVRGHALVEVARREGGDDADDLFEAEAQRRAAGERRNRGAALPAASRFLTTTSLQCGVRFSMTPD
jgi:hypothetical protein